MSTSQTVYMELDQRILEESIKPLITKELIEEHKQNPIGKHSDDLQRVLIYLRRHRLQMQGKYIIVCTQPNHRWCIAELSGLRGIIPRIHEEECFASIAEAEHRIFIQRLKDLGLV